MYFDRTSTTSVLLAALLVLSALTGTAGVAAAATTNAPNGTTHGQIHIESYGVDWAPIQFEGDDGDTVDFRGEVNDSADNPYGFTVTDIQTTDYGAFPRTDGEMNNSASALDATEYTTGGANASAIAVSDVETAPGVDAVNIATDGTMAAGDIATAEYTNVSITSDENKRVLQTALDINTLESGATVELRVVDENGDYKAAEINTTRASGEDFIANQTGEGYLYQHQLGKMTLVASGDGTFDNIQSTKVVVMDGDADLSIAAINVEKMGMWTVGTQKIQNDSDDKLETRTVTEVKTPGDIWITSLDSMGATFESATIHDLTIEFVQDRGDWSDAAVEFEFNVTDNRPGYHGVANIYLPTGLQSAYDISYSDVRTTETQTYLESRYLTVEYAEGIGDTDPANASYTDITSSFTSEGATVTVDDTLQPGQTNYLHYRLQLQKGEFTDAKNALMGGGAAMGPGSGGGNGPFGLNGIPIIGGLISALGGIWRKATGSWPMLG